MLSNRLLVAAALFCGVSLNAAGADLCGSVPPIRIDGATPIERLGDEPMYIIDKDGAVTFVFRPGFSGEVDESEMVMWRKALGSGPLNSCGLPLAVDGDFPREFLADKNLPIAESPMQIYETDADGFKQVELENDELVLSPERVSVIRWSLFFAAAVSFGLTIFVCRKPCIE